MESAFDSQTLVEMSARIASVFDRSGDKAGPICADFAARLLADAKHTAVSLPRQVVSATLNSGEAENLEVRA
jgi:hypothetical protein